MSVNHRSMERGSAGLVDAQLAHRLATAPFEAFGAALFKIDAAETGELVDFEVNEAQQIVLREIRRQEALGRPVRILILKGRQQGMSTFCQAFIAWKLLTRPGVRAAVVGHDLGSTSDLFTKIDVMVDELPEWYKPEIAKRSDGRQLRFAKPLRSAVKYDSAHDPGKVGRGGTRQILHLTETPQWTDEAESMQAVLATVREIAGTYILVETTAKGASGWFYEQFVEGMRKLRRGEEPDFVPIFVPWFKTVAYRRAYRKGEPRLTPAEKKMKARFRLETEQMLWYRDQSKRLGEKVKEEYPSTWREAFLHGGMKFLRKDTLEWLDPEEGEGQAREPIAVGRFRLQASGKALFEKRDMGPTHLFARKEEGHRYSLGLDYAGGRAMDFSAIVVIDWDAADGPQVVATHKSKLLPDQVQREAIILGTYFNKAVIVPDRTGMGEPLVNRLVDEDKYRPVFEQIDETAVKQARTGKYGFNFSGKARMALFEDAADWLHRRRMSISCIRIIEELLTFVYTDETGEKAEAEAGQNDDMVAAWALAVRGRSQLRAPRKPGRGRGSTRRSYC